MPQVESTEAVNARSNGASEQSAVEEDWSWDRLERAVTLLAEQQVQLREELAAMRVALSERDQKVRRLETKLLEANQRRQDTGKRLDELISQLEQLDAQFETEGEAERGAESPE